MYDDSKVGAHGADDDDVRPQIEIEDDDSTVDLDTGEDERLSADQETADDVEERRKRRREERQRKREFQRQDRRKARELEEVVPLLNRKIEELEAKLSQVGARTVGFDSRAVDAEWQQLQNAKARIEADIRHAVETGDGALHARAMKAMMEVPAAEAEIRQKYARVQQEKQQANAPVQGANPLLIAKAKAFASENDDWYGKDDAATAFAQELDRRWSSQGKDPTQDDYWDALEDEVARNFPHIAGGKPAPRADVRPERRGPPIGGRSSSSVSSGGNSLSLTKDEVALIKEAGFWDDPKERMDMARRIKAAREFNR